MIGVLLVIALNGSVCIIKSILVAYAMGIVSVYLDWMEGFLAWVDDHFDNEV